MAQAKLTGVAPVLLTADIEKTAEYYRDRLGFETDLYGDPPGFLIAQRDGIRIMYARCEHKDKMTPNWKIVDKTWNAYFWVDNADAIYEEYQKSGAIIDYTIYDTPWGTREFGIQDLDDHDLAFGQIL